MSQNQNETPQLSPKLLSNRINIASVIFSQLRRMSKVNYLRSTKAQIASIKRKVLRNSEQY